MTTRPGDSGPRNLVALLRERARQERTPAARLKQGGTWATVSWVQLLERVQHLSAGLVASGLTPGDRVALFGATTLTWLECDLAVSAAGGISVPIYASNSPDECRYILKNSGARFAFVDSDVPEGAQEGRLSRLRGKRAEVSGLERIFVFDGPINGPGEQSLSDLRAAGAKAHQASPGAFDQRVERIQANDTECLIYTSGTTGDPKGVVLTHGNWAFEAAGIREIGTMGPHDAVFLFLPLAHSFAQVVKAAWLAMGFELVFAESADKLVANLAEAKPTVLPAVPRVFEKIYSNAVTQARAVPGVKGRLARWAFEQLDRHVEAQLEGRGEGPSWKFALAKRLVFSKVKATLDEKTGGRIRLFISGGAPLSKRIAWFFDTIQYEVVEGYGLTETSAGTTVCRPGHNRIGTVGPALPGVELKIAPDGEVLIRGGGLMKGYYNNPAATAEAIDSEGWFHSGDIGELDSQGFLRITDRKKDLIVTAGGKNVSPQNLENQLKTYPLISQAMVHGDRRKFLSALICVSEEAGKKLLESAPAPRPAGNYAELIQRSEIRSEVQRIIDDVNRQVAPYERVQKFALLDHELTQEAGELTPTLKVKRKVCVQRYKPLLDSLYDEVID